MFEFLRTRTPLQWLMLIVFALIAAAVGAFMAAAGAPLWKVMAMAVSLGVIFVAAAYLGDRNG